MHYYYYYTYGPKRVTSAGKAPPPPTSAFPVAGWSGTGKHVVSGPQACLPFFFPGKARRGEATMAMMMMSDAISHVALASAWYTFPLLFDSPFLFSYLSVCMSVWVSVVVVASVRAAERHGMVGRSVGR